MTTGAPVRRLERDVHGRYVRPQHAVVRGLGVSCIGLDCNRPLGSDAHVPAHGGPLVDRPLRVLHHRPLKLAHLLELALGFVSEAGRPNERPARRKFVADNPAPHPEAHPSYQLLRRRPVAAAHASTSGHDHPSRGPSYSAAIASSSRLLTRRQRSTFLLLYPVGVPATVVSPAARQRAP
jgi:hypothetical protein